MRSAPGTEGDIREQDLSDVTGTTRSSDMTVVTLGMII
jgi:hypothetical protein